MALPPLDSLPSVLLAGGIAEAPLDAGILAPGLDMGVLALMTLTSLFATTFGFGDGILAIPLLALVFGMDVVEAVPLQTMVSSGLGGLILLSDGIGAASGVPQEKIGRFGESLLLFAAAAAGVPFGVEVLLELDPNVIRGAVGVVLIAYGLWALSTDSSEAASSQANETGSTQPVVWPLRALPFGLAAGSLCGAVGEPGPAAILYAQLQSWSPIVVRGMLARFFLPVQMVTLVDFAAQGLLTPGIIQQALCSLPSLVLAVLVGTKLNRSFDPARFATAVDGIVVGLGCVCVYSGFSH